MEQGLDREDDVSKGEGKIQAESRNTVYQDAQSSNVLSLSDSGSFDQSCFSISGPPDESVFS